MSFVHTAPASTEIPARGQDHVRHCAGRTATRCEPTACSSPVNGSTVTTGPKGSSSETRPSMRCRTALSARRTTRPDSGWPPVDDAAVRASVVDELLDTVTLPFRIAAEIDARIVALP